MRGNSHVRCGGGEKLEIVSKVYLFLLTVENILLPTLVIRKWDAHRWRAVPMTQFRIEFEVPNSPHVELIGYRLTDQDGFIILPFVGSGWYRVTETRPAPGMTLNTNNNYRVFLRPGQNSYQLLAQNMMQPSPSMIMPVSITPVPTPPATGTPAPVRPELTLELIQAINAAMAALRAMRNL